ncbi:MAG: hypothetical protein JW751_07105 [Polyangiaceae bacterium]|nr:hypothetical protein [Polyangiaceae bacterium]
MTAPSNVPRPQLRVPPPPPGLRERFTFRGNLLDTRHGWLRLTPAYSLHLVHELIAQRTRPDLPVLDPFAGTGTTLLSCAERAIDAESVDLNPFLCWLAAAKVARYGSADRARARALLADLSAAARDTRRAPAWLPTIHHRERWWLPERAHALGRAFAALSAGSASPRARDLLRLAFCRALIETAHVSFGHQSMSFHPAPEGESASAGAAAVADALARALASVLDAARDALPRARLGAHLDDARTLTSLGRRRYGTVITSPPYANRMSYVRELRPYMYWLGYLKDRRDAGDLDWRAIGGTWGSATSRLTTWKPPTERRVRASGFRQLVAAIATHSTVLASYVHRYFLDLDTHLIAVFPHVAPGGTVHYVVGNSLFYGVGVPTHELVAELLVGAGFSHPAIRLLRPRTSKRGLFEYVVSAERP